MGSLYTSIIPNLIVKEMIESLSLELVAKNLITNQLVMTIIYDIENITNPKIRKRYNGEITINKYGKKVPKNAHGTINLEYHSSSTKFLSNKCLELFEKIINKNLLVRKIIISAHNLIAESKAKNEIVYEQLDFFLNNAHKILKNENERKQEEIELKLQHTLLNIKTKYGKNSILKAMNLEEGATTIERNQQIGGHKEWIILIMKI